jgi:ABC-2 type transport system permease protein
MKNILILTRLNIKRSYYAIILSVFGAAMLSLILYSMGNLISDLTIAKVNVGWLDYDNSTLSKDFSRYLNEELNFALVREDTFDDLVSELIDKDISVIIEIPEDFQQKMLTEAQPEVTITSLEDYENAAFVKAYINSYISSIRILAAGADNNMNNFEQLLNDYTSENITLSRTAATTTDKEELFGESGFINSIGFYLMFIFSITLSRTAATTTDKEELFGESGFINSIGFYLMFIFSISVILAFMVVDDRVKGVFNRIQATPVKPVHYIIGSGIFGLILCFIQIGLFVGYIALKHIKTGIPIGIILLLLILFSLFTVCFSLMIALATKSRNAITAVIIGFSTIGCILGGAYFSLDMAPDSLQKMARILPQYWFMDAFRRIQADVTANIYPNLIILSLYIILSFLIGAVLFAQYYKNN